MQCIEPIKYDLDMSLIENFNMLKMKTGIKTENIAYLCNTSASSVNIYIRNRFKTSGGAKSEIGDKLKSEISKHFTGGIPESVFKTQKKQKVDLYALLKCESCRYRMKSQPGCYKFSHTKAEINNGAWVETLYDGAYNLSEKHRCPHAR